MVMLMLCPHDRANVLQLNHSGHHLVTLHKCEHLVPGLNVFSLSFFVVVILCHNAAEKFIAGSVKRKLLFILRKLSGLTFVPPLRCH